MACEEAGLELQASVLQYQSELVAHSCLWPLDALPLHRTSSCATTLPSACSHYTLQCIGGIAASCKRSNFPLPIPGPRRMAS